MTLHPKGMFGRTSTRFHVVYAVGAYITRRMVGGQPYIASRSHNGWLNIRMMTASAANRLQRIGSVSAAICKKGLTGLKSKPRLEDMKTKQTKATSRKASTGTPVYVLDLSACRADVVRAMLTRYFGEER